MLTAETREQIRQQRSDQRRAEVAAVEPVLCPIGKASTFGYRQGCRCPDCTDSASRDRRRRKKAAQ